MNILKQSDLFGHCPKCRGYLVCMGCRRRKDHLIRYRECPRCNIRLKSEERYTEQAPKNRARAIKRGRTMCQA